MCSVLPSTQVTAEEPRSGAQDSARSHSTCNPVAPSITAPSRTMVAVYPGDAVVDDCGVDRQESIASPRLLDQLHHQHRDQPAVRSCAGAGPGHWAAVALRMLPTRAQA